MTRPASSNQPRAHGLVPRFRYGHTDQHIRVSDAERTEVADRLAARFAEGRLNQAEFDAVSGHVSGLKTWLTVGVIVAIVVYAAGVLSRSRAARGK